MLATTTTVFGTALTAQPGSTGKIGLSVSDVSAAVNDANWVLVDTRPTDAYNGWKLEGVQRGGHLPGAVDFPASWLDGDHESKADILSKALRTKGIEPDRKILLYGTNPRDREHVASYLRSSGFRHLYDFALNH